MILPLQNKNKLTKQLEGELKWENANTVIMIMNTTMVKKI